MSVEAPERCSPTGPGCAPGPGLTSAIAFSAVRIRMVTALRDGGRVPADGLPGRYDVVFTFDVAHDAVDTACLLTAAAGQR